MSLSIVLLAAGEGKRMKTNLPKPLVMLGSDPLVQHSLNTIKIMKPEKTILVTGFKKDEVKKYVLSNNSGDFIFCEQKERLGTGQLSNRLLRTFQLMEKLLCSILMCHWCQLKPLKNLLDLL